MKNIFDIDVVSTMYPAMSTDKTGYSYRMVAVLTEEVNASALKSAVAALAPYFPVLYSHYKKTVSSYYHIRATDFDIVKEGEPYILLPDLYNTNKPSFRVYYKNNRVSVDYFHGNGDGDAAITYLKSLVEVYASYKNKKDVRLPEHLPKDDIYEDKYIKHYDKKRSAQLIGAKKAARLKLDDDDSSDYVRFSCISFSADSLKSVIKEKGLSINDYLITALYFAIIKSDKSFNKKHPVVISAPINLRPFFNESTQRNFSYFVNVTADENTGSEFFSAARYLGGQIKRAANKEFLLNGISQAVKTATNPVVKYAPNFLKEPVIRFICKYISFRGITTTLSNVGFQKSNDILDKEIENLEVYLGAGQRGVLNSTAMGFKDRVSLCLSVASKCEAVENEIISILKGHGVDCEYTKKEFNKYL